MTSVIRFVRPTRTAALTLTGTDCVLGCAHCGGRFLRGMIPIAGLGGVADPQGLRRALTRPGGDPPRSVLVSGGCGPEGRVPLAEHMPLLRRLKAAGLRLNVHPGLVDEPRAREIGAVADTVSFDLVGDDATVREVYGLDRPAADYLESYRLLCRHARVVPHICLGLRGGEMSGEEAALEAVVNEGPPALVLLVFIPTAGTRYADRRPPPLREVRGFIDRARRRLPGVPLHLGCMRPGGRYRTELDSAALEAGVDGIVMPAPAAVRVAGGLGRDISWSEECCAL